jgi:hypothetical protein
LQTYSTRRHALDAVSRTHATQSPTANTAPTLNAQIAAGFTVSSLGS